MRFRPVLEHLTLGFLLLTLLQPLNVLEYGSFLESSAPVDLSRLFQPSSNSTADRVNALRRAEGVSVVNRDTQLDELASARVRDMVERGYFSHVDPWEGDTEFATLLNADGYSYAWAGEILCRSGRAEQCYGHWLQSPTHREILLDPNAERYGLGTYRGHDGREYTAALFAR